VKILTEIFLMSTTAGFQHAVEPIWKSLLHTDNILPLPGLIGHK